MPGRFARPAGEKENPQDQPRHRTVSAWKEVTTRVKTAPAFASASEAMEMAHAALGYLAAADATAMPAETQAWCLRMLEQAHAMGTAARTSVLAAFTAGQGYSRGCGLQPAGVAGQPDQDHQGRRGRLHRVGPPGRRASRRSRRCWRPGRCRSPTRGRSAPGPDKLPEDSRQDADEILLTAAGNGMGLRDLAGLAGEIYARSLPAEPRRR